jgi:hypothetical protein
MKPRVLFVGRSRYRLPLDPAVARKWEALGEQFQVRALATGISGAAQDGMFHLVRDRPLAAFYALLPLQVAREVRAFDPDVVVTQSPYEAVAVGQSRPGGSCWRSAELGHPTRLWVPAPPRPRAASDARARGGPRGRRFGPSRRSRASRTRAGGEPTATFTILRRLPSTERRCAPERPAASSVFSALQERRQSRKRGGAAPRVQGEPAPRGSGRETAR